MISIMCGNLLLKLTILPNLPSCAHITTCDIRLIDSLTTKRVRPRNACIPLLHTYIHTIHSMHEQ